MTKNEFTKMAIRMLSDYPQLKGLWLGESAAKVMKEHVVSMEKRSEEETKKVLYALRANTKREVTRKTLEAAGLCVAAGPLAKGGEYLMKRIVAYDYTKAGCMATAAADA
ncbi:hypothetical protein GN244_ATG08990 [Phytophthora infestans]|uniref:Uncharacterized protein n=1 Tax=Phytophthora infestans TaxID=4787 RepID=A0A833T450_PHYIN|nr:hypothetical protein GN244_ATG08990 [Phytophthora infestans]